MATVRVRFAPSPTGLMHMGNARTALFNWLFARKHQGKFILRIEDTDAQRSTDESVDDIIRDLTWLNLKWDEGFDKGGEYGPYRQTDRTQIYDKHMVILQEQGCVYECFCSPDELEQMRADQLASKKMPRYDNRCRDLSEEKKQIFKDEGRNPVLRFKVPCQEKIVFEDLVRGHMEFDSEMFGDFVLCKSSGDVTFNFAVTVDDACMKISHVIRGEDHLTNTARHIMLFDALGYERPVFAHLPMILGHDGSKLSKRNGLVSLDSYREEGFLAESLVNYMAFLGWSPKSGQEIVSLGDLVDAFDLSDVGRSPATFDVKKMRWINGHHIRAMSAEKLACLAQKYLKEEGLLQEDLAENDFQYLMSVVDAIRGNIEYLSQLPHQAYVFFAENLDYSQDDVKDVLMKRKSKDILVQFRERISELPDLEDATIKALLKQIGVDLEAKGKELFMPIRFGLTASHDGVELSQVVRLLGAQKCIDRLNKAILV